MIFLLKRLHILLKFEKLSPTLLSPSTMHIPSVNQQILQLPSNQSYPPGPLRPLLQSYMSYHISPLLVMSPLIYLLHWKIMQIWLSPLFNSSALMTAKVFISLELHTRLGHYLPLLFYIPLLSFHVCLSPFGHTGLW